MMKSISQDKLNFIKHVVLNAPPGKLDTLVSDLKTLLGSGPSIISMIERTIEEYNEANYSMVPIVHDDNDTDEYVVVCQQAKQNNSYLHPKSNQLIQINHAKRKMLKKKNSENLEYSEELESYRKMCEEKLEKYTEIHYSKWSDIQIANYPSVNIKSKNGLNIKCSSAVYAKEVENRYNLFFIICCDRCYLKNFHCSSWRSTWNVNFSPTDEKILLQGTIYIAINYFEDANMNFKTTKHFEKKIPMCSDVDKFSSSILSSISEYENYTLYDLNNFLLNINIALVKNTRKILPLNGEKFDWKNMYHDISIQISRS